mmetsp:Transcript_4828/g.7342  ORF Transcript_4828/g.7342 Transcript_4828/m.7342 type:complete len:358 (+) Transcript_4828:117-1190(+)
MEQCNLIVNYLPLYVDDSALTELFSPFGEILQVNIARNKTTGESLSYGFVKFARAEDANSAIAARNGYRVGNKQLKVSVARPKPADIQNRKLFVSKLPLSYTESQVRELFAEYGDIIECRLLLESDRTTSRGSAFVEYNLASECEAALTAMHEKTPPGATNSICVYYARPPPLSDSSSSDVSRIAAHSPPATQTPPWVGGPWSAPPSNASFPVPYAIAPQGAYIAPPAAPYPQMSRSSPVQQFHHSSATHYRSFFPESSRTPDMQEVSLEVFGLPPNVNVKMLVEIFEPFGHVTALVIDHSLSNYRVVSCGNGWAKLITTPQQVQDLFRLVHNTCVFPGYPPIQLLLFQPSCESSNV